MLLSKVLQCDQVLKSTLGMVAPDVEIDDGKGMIQFQLLTSYDMTNPPIMQFSSVYF